MKLTIKTLQNTTFKVDIELDKTVKEFKETIEKEQGKDYPSSSQKLIYNGKILADENKLTEYQFDEKKFVVLMITRPPPLPKATTTQDQTTSSSSNNSKQKSDEKPKPSMAAPHPPTTAPTRQSQTTSSVSSTPATVTSTPNITDPNTATQQPVSARSTNFNDASSQPTNDTQARLSNLMRQAQFRQMQDLIQQSPHLLSSTIESLAASDPEMYNFISENPDVFVNALNHPPMADARPGQQLGGSAQRGTAQGRGSSQQPAGQSVDLLVNVSEHDKEAIERLKELGFSEYLAVQAYMACDKDEQLAANLLFQMDQ